MNLQTRILDDIARHQLFSSHDRLLVGVSAGSDSVALLCLLHEVAASNRLAAAYIDHQLRPNEVEREKHLIEDLCHQFGIPYFTEAIDVSREQKITGESPEACARRLRYNALEMIRIRAGADLIAVGHTGDDQAEQVLLRLLRGTGRKGLSGMAWKNGRIIRPLLGVEKAALAAYLLEKNISSCFDSSNMSLRFLRNRIRLELLPLLARNYQPEITPILRRTASILAVEEDFLEQESDRFFTTIGKTRTSQTSPAGQQHKLPIEPLLSLHRAVQRRVIERLCWESGSRPSFEHIESIIACADSGTTGTMLTLPGGVVVFRERQQLTFCRTAQAGRPDLHRAFSRSLSLAKQGEWQVGDINARIVLTITEAPVDSNPGSLTVDADTVSFPLLLRAPYAGERFTPAGATVSKKVMRFLAEKSIPRHRRYRYPVLVDGNTIVAIPGISVSREHAVSSQTRRFLTITREDLNDGK